MKLVWGLLVIPGFVLANTGTDLLINKSTETSVAPIVQVQKQIVLDNPFLIQFYGVWKASRIYDKDFTSWVDLILDKKHPEALKMAYTVKADSKAKSEMLNAAKLYLLWDLKFNQTFFNEWLSLVSEQDFFNSQFSHAIDQIAGTNASEWFVSNAIYINPEQRQKLAKISKINSVINNSAQAVFNLRSGLAGMSLIRRLPADDKLRLKLGDSLILGYARKNELANSAKLLKEIYEPVLANESDVNKLSAYYMLLARLLYQAKAFDAAEHYYGLIPDESKKFLSARIEKLWISMRNSDLAKIKGELKTLSLKIFEDQFLPEVHLVSAMANLKLCQFKDVEKNFSDYVRIQGKFAKEIEANLVSTNPKIIDHDDFYMNRLINNEKALTAEIANLVKMDEKVFGKQIAIHNSIIKAAEFDRTREVKRKWRNRKKMMELSIRKMRFVKVEFLSLMRRLKSSLAKVKTDEINMKSAGIEKFDKLVFPYDGVMFSDELFHYQSDLQNLCLRGRL